MWDELPKGAETAGTVLGEITFGVIGWYVFLNVSEWRTVSFWLFIGLALLAFFVLFAASVWVLRRIHRPYPRGYCRQCGYDMRKTPKRCPECGRVGDSVYANI